MDKRDITLYFPRFITYYFKALIPLTVYPVTEIVSICHLTLKLPAMATRLGALPGIGILPIVADFTTDSPFCPFAGLVLSHNFALIKYLIKFYLN